jgi:hypothetical protein
MDRFQALKTPLENITAAESDCAINFMLFKEKSRAVMWQRMNYTHRLGAIALIW